MIEFNGYLSGTSEKHLHKINRAFGIKLLLSSLIITLPIVLFWEVQSHNHIFIGVYCAAIVFVLLFAFIPQSKKDRKMITPKRIFTDGEIITCIADKYEETRYVQDVKTVKDYEEFYELIFPFGKISHYFICQKNLLSEGTLEDFEKLFEGKIVSC